MSHITLACCYRPLRGYRLILMKSCDDKDWGGCCSVFFSNGIDRLTYNLLMRAMYALVPVYAVSNVHIVKNSLMRHMPSECLKQRLENLVVEVSESNRYISMRYSANFPRCVPGRRLV